MEKKIKDIIDGKKPIQKSVAMMDAPTRLNAATRKAANKTEIFKAVNNCVNPEGISIMIHIDMPKNIPLSKSTTEKIKKCFDFQLDEGESFC